MDGGDAGFVEVGEGRKQRAGKPGSVVNGGEIALGKQIARDAPAEQFEAKRRGCLAGGQIGQRGEMDVDVAVGQGASEGASKMKREQPGGTDDMERS